MTYLTERIGPFLPALICLASITMLSLSPGVQLPGFRIVSADKLAHAAAYGVLSILIAYGLYEKRRSMLSPAAWISVGLAASAYGALMEWAQYFFAPGRFFEYDDMIANGVGAALGLWAFAWFLKQKNK
ncbi:MAG: VanZ family protein [Saprospiraceae bacterium]